jgi:hypothetical protein
MRVKGPVLVAIMLVSPCMTAAAQAQDGINHVRPTCASNNALVRTAVGGTLGAWLGFVAAKIKMSDWNDASRGPAANRTRNNATIGGAVVGAALANMLFRSHACGSEVPHVAKARAPQSTAHRPITVEEIERSGVNGSVYELVSTLRRNWLNFRGFNTISEGPSSASAVVSEEPNLVVYLDNARLGTTAELRNLPVAGVIGVRYFDPAEATYRWGAGHQHGAIQVQMVIEPTEK